MEIEEIDDDEAVYQSVKNYKGIFSSHPDSQKSKKNDHWQKMLHRGKIITEIGNYHDSNSGIIPVVVTN